MRIISNWPKDKDGVHLGCCIMCLNKGITHFQPGLPSSYCGPCYRAGHYTLEDLE